MSKFLYIQIKSYDKDNNEIPVIGVVSSSKTLTYIGIDNKVQNELLNSGKSIEKLIIPSKALAMDANKNPTRTIIKRIDLRVFSQKSNNDEFDFILDDIKCPIENMIIEPGIQALERYVFSESQVVRVHWPEDILSIPEGAFSSCKLLEQISGIENVTSIASEAFAKTNFKTFNWPNNCPVIPGFCFYECKKLSEFNIKRKDIEVGTLAFSYTKLKEFNAAGMFSFSSAENSFPSSCKIQKPFYEME